MRMKTALVFLFIALIAAGCGYRMDIGGDRAAFTLYPKQITNNTTETDGRRIFTNEVKFYLTTIGALKDEDQTANLAYFTLDSVSTSAAVKLKSGQTATVDVTIAMTAKVTDKDGKVIFEKQLKSSSTYSQAYSLSSSISNREDAIKECIRIAMEDFRYGFENR